MMHFLLETEEIKNAMEEFRNERLGLYQELYENDGKFRMKHIELLKNKTTEELIVDYVYRKLLEERRI